MIGKGHDAVISMNIWAQTPPEYSQGLGTGAAPWGYQGDALIIHDGWKGPNAFILCNKHGQK